MAQKRGLSAPMKGGAVKLVGVVFMVMCRLISRLPLTVLEG